MKRILLLSPHPDDESIGAGGTLYSHTRNGDLVRVIFLTSGEGGGHGLEAGKIAGIREKEAKRAAKVLGIQEVEFWRNPDGALKVTSSLTRQLAETLLSFKPAVIYTPHDKEDHPDHRAAVRLLKKALGTVMGKLKKQPQVLMYEIWTPLQRMDHIHDITAFISNKREAIRCHKSQCKIMAFDDAALGLNRYRGEMHCWPEGDYAEVFAEVNMYNI